MPINYDDEITRAIRDNLVDVRDSLGTEWLITKIQNFVNKHEVATYDEIVEQIRTNDVVASFFAKDPSKQGIHEKVAGIYLSNTFGQEILPLPKSGNNALYVVNGHVTSTRPNKNFKSIDFKFQYRNKTIVISHKYTKEAGGAQDNQRNDLSHFIGSADPAQENTIFVALADGEYYQASGMRNLIEIQDQSRNRCSIVATSNTLIEKLDELIDELDA